MKPLISYYGGKQRIASKILPYFPKHTVYVEPFAGGAALLFAKPRRVVSNADNYREVLNDKNDLLINLYRVAIERTQELELKIQGTLYSQSDHRKSKEIIKNPDSYDDLTRAWAFYVNINQSFASKLNGGWGTGTTGGSLAPAWNTRKIHISKILDRIKDIYISNEDAIRCIQRWDSPQTLFYCDPPYPGTDQGHYNGYTLDNFKSLCEALDNAQGSYVLSNYPQQIEPQSAQQRIEIEALMSANNKDMSGGGHATKRTEILWICDRSSGIRSDLKAIANHNADQLSLF